MTEAVVFPDLEIETSRAKTSSTFIDNMKLPVHRWFRYSAGFSAQWVESVIANKKLEDDVVVLDPFAGSGTTLIAAERMGVECYGIEAHPFMTRVARAKLYYRSDPTKYEECVKKIEGYADKLQGRVESFPPLVRKCFDGDVLKYLDCLFQAWTYFADDSPYSELAWLTIIAILRNVSHVGTAPWQYILPKKTKKAPLNPRTALALMISTIKNDMSIAGKITGPRARLINSDARNCKGVPSSAVNLIITSPPYTNNYDYADATRLEMSFVKEVRSWGELQDKVRKYLMRSCSQHVPEKTVNLQEVLSSAELEPIRDDISRVCQKLSHVRYQHGGRKTYHLMVACYFFDMSKAWKALRRVCKQNSSVCFVIGDSAPYGIYVPVIDWNGRLAKAAGFKEFTFEKTRDRNVKWKNRKHRVPLCEGRLWVYG